MLTENEKILVAMGIIFFLGMIGFIWLLFNTENEDKPKSKSYKSYQPKPYQPFKQVTTKYYYQPKKIEEVETADTVSKSRFECSKPISGVEAKKF